MAMTPALRRKTALCLLAINNSSSLSRALREFGHVKVASRPFRFWVSFEDGDLEKLIRYPRPFSAK